ncbi:cellulose synthase subunit BcsC [Posidoniimonas corsicana]|uniref:Cellulose synthase subunit BcsC n=1 Tax=Posidoniimonas corsicana TaxID=1938618 RepID=A0A5C5VHZ7_9BACT|nr:tetratricopeptide repeat protein [Posidoniimonas corsicana]TWT37302.1 cellulose synthase subunit BcsC [Posidoniimonas corsicana]
MISPHLQRAQILIEQHRCRDAEKELGLAIGQDPDDAWAHALLAICLSDRGAHHEASERARQAVGLAPDSPQVRQLAARVELSRNALDTAERLFTEAIQLNPGDEDSYAGRASVHARRKAWRAALADVDQALAIDPENIEAINLRSLANRGLGRSDAGRQDVEQALRVDPNDAASHANLGWSCLERHDLTQAERHFREALRLDPSLEWARVGVLETTKARFPIYRWLLSYFLWMARLTGKAQFAILFGLYFVNRAVSSAAEAYPAWAPVLQPLSWLYLMFCVMTWFIQPLGNATLLLHPFARMALNKREKTEALIVGGLFTTMLSLIVGSFFDPTNICKALTLLLGVPALPFGLSWRFKHPKPWRIMMLITSGVLLCELAFCIQVALNVGWVALPTGSLGLVSLGAQLFLFSPLAVLIGANLLAAKNWRLQ